MTVARPFRRHLLEVRVSTIRALLFLVLLCTAPLMAQERILSYDSALRLDADGGLEVTERIRVRAEGTNIRRGVYRTFPTRYRDRHGNRITVQFEMLDLQRDGRPEPYFIERLSNGVRINTGNDDLLPVPAEFTYTLRYRATRQVGFFDAHDELYWNAIGTGWDFPIEAGSATLQLPQPVPATALLAECWTGAQGSRAQACEAAITAPGQARWTLTAPLQPGEGLTTTLAFPKGLVPEPTRQQRLARLLGDNRAALIALAGWMAMLVFGLVRWRQVGRDPKPGPIVVTYDPPDALSPATLRYIEKNHVDTRAFSADVLALAVAGHVGIHREGKRLGDEWRITRAHGDGALEAGQQALLTDLFESGETLEFKNTHARRMQTLLSGHQRRIKQAMGTRFRGGLYRPNGGSIALMALIAGVSLCAAVLFGIRTGTGLALAVPVFGAMLVTFFAFAFLLPAATPAGRAMRDRIEGFRRYLTVADRQDLQRLQGPDAPEPALDAGRFETLLPYAVALDVEDAWTKKFTAAVGSAAVAAATTSMAWYHASGRGSSGPGDIAGFSKAIGSGFASQIAASATPPGSASGSSFGGGGGGFSGGGGGGGGGGGR
ncbi:DUF2207 domain-containing protein [Luteimonas sp BLCC-B24]|uniref:DUF2207 domain-containing protein n=1 Tax=Luteimonas sp. BLCC-B24 TaxID=3025317 RepID=UPI00234DBB30|nr:DUF2207 domain-containing protein [Luteimonas sp. BLCC-B24]MDC7806726.1 DUF2207 domain-containing protein [Luteimonas sp. BLCC-B24]